jgi:hypothetical protein
MRWRRSAATASAASCSARSASSASSSSVHRSCTHKQAHTQRPQRPPGRKPACTREQGSAASVRVPHTPHVHVCGLQQCYTAARCEGQMRASRVVVVVVVGGGAHLQPTPLLLLHLELLLQASHLSPGRCQVMRHSCRLRLHTRPRHTPTAQGTWHTAHGTCISHMHTNTHAHAHAQAQAPAPAQAPAHTPDFDSVGNPGPIGHPCPTTSHASDEEQPPIVPIDTLLPPANTALDHPGPLACVSARRVVMASTSLWVSSMAMRASLSWRCTVLASDRSHASVASTWASWARSASLTARAAADVPATANTQRLMHSSGVSRTPTKAHTHGHDSRAALQRAATDVPATAHTQRHMHSCGISRTLTKAHTHGHE